MIKISELAAIILDNYLTGLAVIAVVSSVVSYVLTFILIWVAEKYLKKIKLLPEENLVRQNFFPLLWFLFTLFGFRTLLPLAEVPEAVLNVINTTWQVIVIIVSTWFFINFVSFLKQVILNRYYEIAKNRFEKRKINTQLDFVERIIFVILILIGFTAILLSFEGARKIGTSLIASTGLAGIIIGFAAQKTIANLIAGFQIAFTQPFRIDDVVIVQGEWGKIEEITLTYVVIRIWDKRRLIVPITYLLENPFQNWTRNEEEILGYVYIYADYSVPMETLREEFHRLLQETELWNKDVAVVQVTNSTEKTQEIRFLVSADDSGKAWDLRCYLRERLIKFIQQNYPESLPKHRISSEKPF